MDLATVIFFLNLVFWVKKDLNEFLLYRTVLNKNMCELQLEVNLMRVVTLNQNIVTLWAAKQKQGAKWCLNFTQGYKDFIDSEEI